MRLYYATCDYVRVCAGDYVRTNAFCVCYVRDYVRSKMKEFYYVRPTVIMCGLCAGAVHIIKCRTSSHEIRDFLI